MCGKEPDTDFNKLLKPYLQEFVEMHSKFKVEGINPDTKNRKLSLFSDINRKDEWGENYCVTYWASFAQLAQAQRHRTLSYELIVYSLDSDKYYVPPIIKGTEKENEWLKDIASLSKYFPQGKMILVNERGTVENFILKCKERLCGCAQLEIALQTKETLDLYLKNTKETNKRVYDYLMQYASGARCTFADFECTKPCIWGAKKALDRLC